MQINDFPVYLTVREKGVVPEPCCDPGAPTDVYTATYHEGATVAEDSIGQLCPRFAEAGVDEKAQGPFALVPGQPTAALIAKDQDGVWLDQVGATPTKLNAENGWLDSLRLVSGSRVACGADRNELLSYDPETDRLKALVDLPKGRDIWDLALNHDGSRILMAVGDHNNEENSADELTWFDRATGKLEPVPLEQGARISCMALSPDEQSVATTDGFNVVTRNLTTGDARALSLPADREADLEPRSVAFSPDGSRVLYACSEVSWPEGHYHLASELYAASVEGGPSKRLLGDETGDYVVSAYPTERVVGAFSVVGATDDPLDAAVAMGARQLERAGVGFGRGLAKDFSNNRPANAAMLGGTTELGEVFELASHAPQLGAFASVRAKKAHVVDGGAVSLGTRELAVIDGETVVVA